MNEEYGVVQLTNALNTNRQNLKLYESVILLILRILFDEKKRELSVSDEVIVNLGDIQDKFLSLKIRDKMIDKTTMGNALRLFRRYQLIELLDSDLKNEESRVLIYNSILMAVRVEDIKSVYDKVDSYRKGKLKDAFNRLMDEIMKLKIQSYEKQIDLQETELKCIKLQIRPHFFLNAMTTISSLSQQGKNKEIESYISALSKNIRYMFRAGLHTVSLQEEVTHVENYFEMQELKYPGCVFYYIDINPEVREWKIPQMMIVTPFWSACADAYTKKEFL